MWLLLATAGPAYPQERCVGDCNVDGVVSIAELGRGVAMAATNFWTMHCASFDPDRDGYVQIADLVTGVRNALEGCPTPPPPIDGCCAVARRLKGGRPAHPSPVFPTQDLCCAYSATTLMISAVYWCSSLDAHTGQCAEDSCAEACRGLDGPPRVR
jgi:hypothetical protein